MRGLLLAVVAVSIWCAMASWSIFGAIFLLGWALCVSQVFWDRQKFQQQKPWKQAAALITLAVLLLMCFVIPTLQSVRTTAVGRLSFVVLDARDKLPVPGALVELIANADIYNNHFENTNSAGVANLSATFQAHQLAGAWGRRSTTLDYHDTDVIVYAKGYETRVLHWEDISPEAYRSEDAPPGEPIVIELQPLSETAKR